MKYSILQKYKTAKSAEPYVTTDKGATVFGRYNKCPYVSYGYAAQKYNDEYRSYGMMVMLSDYFCETNKFVDKDIYFMELFCDEIENNNITAAEQLSATTMFLYPDTIYELGPKVDSEMPGTNNVRIFEPIVNTLNDNKSITAVVHLSGAHYTSTKNLKIESINEHTFIEI